MTEQEAAAVINQVFEEYFEIEPERLQPEMNIFEDLELDSLDIVDLVVAMQKELKVVIREDERIRNIRTLGDIYEFVVLLQSEAEIAAAKNGRE